MLCWRNRIDKNGLLWEDLHIPESGKPYAHEKCGEVKDERLCLAEEAMTTPLASVSTTPERAQSEATPVETQVLAQDAATDATDEIEESEAMDATMNKPQIDLVESVNELPDVNSLAEQRTESVESIVEAPDTPKEDFKQEMAVEPLESAITEKETQLELMETEEFTPKDAKSVIETAQPIANVSEISSSLSVYNNTWVDMPARLSEFPVIAPRENTPTDSPPGFVCYNDQNYRALANQRMILKERLFIKEFIRSQKLDISLLVPNPKPDTDLLEQLLDEVTLPDYKKADSLLRTDPFAALDKFSTYQLRNNTACGPDSPLMDFASSSFHPALALAKEQVVYPEHVIPIPPELVTFPTLESNFASIYFNERNVLDEFDKLTR